MRCWRTHIRTRAPDSPSPGVAQTIFRIADAGGLTIIPVGDAGPLLPPSVGQVHLPEGLTEPGRVASGDELFAALSADFEGFARFRARVTGKGVARGPAFHRLSAAIRNLGQKMGRKGKAQLPHAEVIIIERKPPRWPERPGFGSSMEARGPRSLGVLRYFGTPSSPAGHYPRIPIMTEVEPTAPRDDRAWPRGAVPLSLILGLITLAGGIVGNRGRSIFPLPCLLIGLLAGASLLVIAIRRWLSVGSIPAGLGRFAGILPLADRSSLS